jgi:two-component system response regulator MprA
MARILVVEDSELLSEAIRDALELDGYNVRVVANGVQAMEAFSHFRPDLIVTDVIMPGTGGFELYRQVRRESPDTAILFIFTTAWGATLAVEQVTGSKSAYLTKPFGLDELLGAVRKLL